MIVREYAWLTTAREVQELDSVPGWARAEHMEVTVPLKEVWRYPESFRPKEKLITNLIRKMRRI